MKSYTKETVYELFDKKYRLNYIDDEERREICQNRLRQFLDEIYDLSKDKVDPLSQSQTLVFRKTYGVLDNGLGKTQYELSDELGLTHQAISLRLQNIMKKDLPQILYIGEENKTLEVEKILSIPIDELGFGQKAYRCLKNAGVMNLRDIISLTSEELMYMYSLGAKGRKQLEDTVHSYGLKFVDEVEKEKADSMLKIIEEGTTKEDSINQDFLKLSINVMEFSPRAYNCLRRAGIDTLKELISLTTIDLEKIHNLGDKVLLEVKEKVYSYGLKFADEEKIEQANLMLEGTGNTKYSIQEFLQLPIEAMELSVRTYNALKRAGIQTVQEIICTPTISLKKIRFLGAKGLNEIANKVSIYESRLGIFLSPDKSLPEECSISEELIQRRNVLVSRYNELFREKEDLLLREAEIKKEMSDILLEFNSSRKEGEKDGPKKSIGRLPSSGRTNQGSNK